MMGTLFGVELFSGHTLETFDKGVTACRQMDRQMTFQLNLYSPTLDEYHCMVYVTLSLLNFLGLYVEQTQTMVKNYYQQQMIWCSKMIFKYNEKRLEVYDDVHIRHFVIKMFFDD